MIKVEFNYKPCKNELLKVKAKCLDVDDYYIKRLNLYVTDQNDNEFLIENRELYEEIKTLAHELLLEEKYTL